jgi:DNA-binding MarR family transcriptional regulator
MPSKAPVIDIPTVSNQKSDADPIRERREQVGFLLRKAYQRNMAIWQANSIDPQLTSVQAAVLSTLWDIGPCSLTELGREAAMDPATTRGVVDRLHERKMISLMSDVADARKVIVRLQPSGRKLIASMRPALRRIADLTMARLNPAERIALVFLLKRVAFGEDELEALSR